MPVADHPWRSPVLTTGSDAAVRAYRIGIASLVAGAAQAEASLEAAVAADPDFALARVGLAAARFRRGGPYVAAPLRSSGLTRGERHHAEIVEATCLGDVDHAADLRREHLLDYPADLLVVWAPILRRSDR
jgi:hypothetical protein